MCSLAGSVGGGVTSATARNRWVYAAAFSRRRLHPARNGILASSTGLHRVQPTVGPDFVVMVLPGAAMQPRPPQPTGQLVFLGEDHAAVSPPTEVLAGKE